MLLFTLNLGLMPESHVHTHKHTHITCGNSRGNQCSDCSDMSHPTIEESMMSLGPPEHPSLRTELSLARSERKLAANAGRVNSVNYTPRQKDLLKDTKLMKISQNKSGQDNHISFDRALK